MHGRAKILLVRHSVHGERQSLPDQRPRPRHPPCKNRGSSIVPDQHRHGAARGGREGPEDGAVGVGQGGQPPGGVDDGPAGGVGGDGPAAVPDGFDAGDEEKRGRGTACEFAGFAGEADMIAAGLEASAAQGGDEILAAAQPREGSCQAVAARKAVAAADADQGGGEDVAVGGPVDCQRSLSHRERG